MGKTDFVILWVDGNDPAWLAQKSKYLPEQSADIRAQRYRDWDNLQYWFRGVEKFAPWVNRIHFVTWGHVPSWLNTDHPKLNIVKHTDFIPAQYLPTFSCNTIELNLHRIRGLEEQFVYFNDDMFLIAPTEERDFFRKGLPCDSACLNVHCFNNLSSGWTYAPLQAVSFINKYFDMHDVIKKSPFKWFNLKYGTYALRTLYLLPCPRFPGIWQPHMPTSYLKQTLRELWEKEGGIFDETCKNRFRTPLDYTQNTLRAYQLASGRFMPRSAYCGKPFYLGEASFGDSNKRTINTVCNYIIKQKGKMTCINDGELTVEEFDYNKNRIKWAFEKILPDQCAYEL